MIAGIDNCCLNILERWEFACFRREGDLYGTRKRTKKTQSTNHNVLFNYRTQKVDWVYSKQVTIVLCFEWELSMITRWALRSMGYIFSLCLVAFLLCLVYGGGGLLASSSLSTTFEGNGRSRSRFWLLHEGTLLYLHVRIIHLLRFPRAS